MALLQHLGHEPAGLASVYADVSHAGGVVARSAAGGFPEILGPDGQPHGLRISVSGTAGPTYPSGVTNRWAGNDNANDAVGSNNGTWTGTPAYVAGAKAVTGNAFSFGGANYVSVGALTVGSTFSLAAWIKPGRNNTSSRDIIAGNWKASTNQRSFVLYYNSTPGSGLPVGGVSSNGTNFVTRYGSTTLTNGTWWFVVLTWDGSTLLLYVNGAAETMTNLGSSGTPSGAPYNNGLATHIGHVTYIDTAERFTLGAADDVTMFSVCLTPTQVAALYASYDSVMTTGYVQTRSF
ncbi:MAG: hypothetical protein BIFFINMI_02917 [Phycisphaerae bacterium]|nr:hypothetical protein [Phycisphaerae bacterium]